jgi:hypothetical protein
VIFANDWKKINNDWKKMGAVFFYKKRETGNRKKRENGKAGKREIFKIGLISQKKIIVQQ